MAKQYADWGIDYLKYDWNPIEIPETKAEFDILRNSGRDIVLSLSSYGHVARCDDDKSGPLGGIRLADG